MKLTYLNVFHKRYVLTRQGKLYSIHRNYKNFIEAPEQDRSNIASISNTGLITFTNDETADIRDLSLWDESYVDP